MFVETITAPLEEWQQWADRLRIVSEPPDALVASIAWAGADGLVTSVNVWDSPVAVGEFYMERVGPLVQAEGEPLNKPNATASLSRYTSGADRYSEKRSSFHGSASLL